jgi:hypothetical protein
VLQARAGKYLTGLDSLRRCSPSETGAAIGDEPIVIGGWTSPGSKQLTLQDFIRDGKSFIPVFSDAVHFRAGIKGSGFEDRGLSIKRALLASLRRDDALLILNPASIDPQALRKADRARAAGLPQ